MALMRRTVVLGTAAMAATPARGQPVKIRLGTATPGGGFPVYGNALAEVMNAADATLFSHHIPRRLSAEQLQDAIGYASRTIQPM